MSTTTSSIQGPLAGLRVGISGAVPEREFWGEVRDLDRVILTFISQLSTLIMEYGGQVVHGTQPAFAPVLAEEARQYIERRAEPLKLIASQLWGEHPELGVRYARIARAPLLLTPKIGEGAPTDPPTRNDSLTALRLTITQEIDVLIAVGGKLHPETGFNPGIVEELAQARWRDIPCFVIGAFGGAAGRLEAGMVKQFSEDNFMSEEQALGLARWTNHMDEQVGNLVVHLAKHREEFQHRREGPSRQFEGLQYHFLEKVHPAVELGTAIVNVDIDLIKRSSQRLAELRRALDSSNVSEVGQILQGKWNT
jgi:SLOG cluster2